MDHRPESYKISVDTIACDPKPLSTRNLWRERRIWLDKLPVFTDFAALEAERKDLGGTLGLVRPKRVVELDITAAARPEWTPAEKAKLIQLQQQGSLFDNTDAGSIATLRKVPFDFHYSYVCNGQSGQVEYRHKIADWEAGALYWNVRRSHGDKWEAAFKAKLEYELPHRDLMFLMVSMSNRFQLRPPFRVQKRPPLDEV